MISRSMRLSRGALSGMTSSCMLRVRVFLLQSSSHLSEEQGTSRGERGS